MVSHYQIICFLLAIASIITAAPTHKPRAEETTTIDRAQSAYRTNSINLITSGNTSCTPDKILYRQAWDDLPSNERSDYLRAMQCIQTKPSRTNPELASGARNWWDDFTYTHINQTNFVHVSGLLLPWHRQFMWAWEQTLRNECGYSGALPYWPWERHSDNQSASPVFQADSFGGNGLYVPHNATNGSSVGIDPPLFFPRAAGTGGGCITDGAFANRTVNLGPVSPAQNAEDNVYGLKYNPRCVTRDFLQETSTENLTYATIANLYQTTSIHEFHPLIESTAHLNSHNYIGSGSIDLYASPNEPVFWLLHAQIDRLWTVWQGQDYSTRLTALDGTLTIQNIPPSENATLESIMTMGVAAGGDLPISHAMNTLDGDYCYMYI